MTHAEVPSSQRFALWCSTLVGGCVGCCCCVCIEPVGVFCKGAENAGCMLELMGWAEMKWILILW